MHDFNLGAKVPNNDACIFRLYAATMESFSFCSTRVFPTLLEHPPPKEAPKCQAF